MRRALWILALAGLAWLGWWTHEQVQTLGLARWDGSAWHLIATGWRVVFAWIPAAGLLAGLALGLAVARQAAHRAERRAVRFELEQALRDAHEAAHEASEARKALRRVQDYREHLKKAAERDSLAEEARQLRRLHSRERAQLAEVRRLAQLMRTEIRKPEPNTRNLGRLARKIIDAMEVER